MAFSEVIATIQTVDPGMARFVSRRLMEVWAYYLPLLGVSPEDFELNVVIQPVPELEDDMVDTIAPLLRTSLGDIPVIGEAVA